MSEIGRTVLSLQSEGGEDLTIKLHTQARDERYQSSDAPVTRIFNCSELRVAELIRAHHGILFYTYNGESVRIEVGGISGEAPTAYDTNIAVGATPAETIILSSALADPTFETGEFPFPGFEHTTFDNRFRVERPTGALTVFASSQSFLEASTPRMMGNAGFLGSITE